MVATLNSGPMITAGNLIDSSGSGLPQITNPSAGPNLNYHGAGFLDVRSFPINKDVTDRHGVIPAFLNSTPILTINAIPIAKSNTNIVTGAHPATGVAMTLNTSDAAGITHGIPFLVYGTSTVTVAPITLDFGYELVSVATTSAHTVTVADSTKYVIGQPLIIGGAATATTPLITYVTAIASATTLTIAGTIGHTNASAPCGSGNSWSALDNLSPIQLSTYTQPYFAGGPGLFFNPTEAVSRCVSVTGLSGGSGGTVTIAGWDIYGQPMTDTITLAAGANTVNSLKAFKYIKSVTPAFTDSNNIEIGTADIFGMPLRNDLFEQLNIYDDGAAVTANTGWVAADATTPATATTGDVRGTYAVQNASTTTSRLAIYQIPSFQQLVRSGPANYVSLYGVTQV